MIKNKTPVSLFLPFCALSRYLILYSVPEKRSVQICFILQAEQFLHKNGSNGNRISRLLNAFFNFLTNVYWVRRGTVDRHTVGPESLPPGLFL